MDASETRWLLFDDSDIDEPVSLEEIVVLFRDRVVTVDSIVQAVQQSDDGTWQSISEPRPLCDDPTLFDVAGEILNNRNIVIPGFPDDRDRGGAETNLKRKKSNDSFAVLFVVGFFPLFLLGTLFFSDGSTPWMYPTPQEVVEQPGETYQPNGAMKKFVSVAFAMYLGVVAAWIIFGIRNLMVPQKFPTQRHLSN